MSLQFLHLGQDPKGPQIRTAGIWNIAVAIERLEAELYAAREEASKLPGIFTGQFGSDTFRFTLRSGQTHIGIVANYLRGWFLIERSDRSRVFIPIDAIESIADEQSTA